MAKLKEEKARPKQISDEEKEVAREDSGRASTSLRSFSPLPT